VSTPRQKFFFLWLLHRSSGRKGGMVSSSAVPRPLRCEAGYKYPVNPSACQPVHDFAIARDSDSDPSLTASDPPYGSTTGPDPATSNSDASPECRSQVALDPECNRPSASPDRPVRKVAATKRDINIAAPVSIWWVCPRASSTARTPVDFSCRYEAGYKYRRPLSTGWCVP
jgi:hypothetical protein